MYTRFIGSENWKGLSATYIHDNQVDFINNTINIDGNLTTTFSNVLSNVSDFQKNNYSHLFLTQPVDLSVITDFVSPEPTSTICFGTISQTFNGVEYFLKFTDQLDATYAFYSIFDIIMDTRLSAVTDLNFFEVDISSLERATIAHYYNGQKYYLCFNPATLNLNMLSLSAFNNVTDYSRQFYYILNKQNKIITFQARVNNAPYTLIRDPSTMRLILTAAEDVSFSNSKRIFTLDTFFDPSLPEITNNWVTYNKGINQNNININTNDSHFNVKNNFILHSEYVTTTDKKYTANILTLKNQLNIQNHQGRGGLALGDETTYRRYNTILAGNKQEKGYDKLSLSYTSYSTPYVFNQGKTTWFHMPQSIYPYKRLNINSSSLVEAGAVAGDHPLRSDRVWKKIGNYKYTSNLGTASEEHTGRWLCSWLSGAPDVNVRPVWVDRFYNPNNNTPYTALTAGEGTVTYIPSFDCYDLSYGVIDVPSSLTFEPGCWYAYSHIGKSDALQNINVWSSVIQQDHILYFLYNYQQLDPEVYQGDAIYRFDGNRFGYFDVDNFNIPQNTFTIAFWAHRDDWSIPIGYQLAGNYMDYGLGIFNYKLVTPFLFYLDNGKIVSLNQDLQVLNTFDSGVSAFGKIRHVLRRDPLNSFHTITENDQTLEFDLKETIVDATSALSGAGGIRIGIKDVHNDANYAYVLYNNNRIVKLDLVSNLAVPAVSSFIVGNPRNIREILPVNNQIALIDGVQSVFRDSKIYTLSSGSIKVYDTTTREVCAFVGTNRDSYRCFNIDRYSNTWVGSGNIIDVFGQYQTRLFSVSLSAASSLSTKPISIQNITFIENFNEGELNTNVIVAATGSDTNKAILYKLDYNGGILKTTAINARGFILSTFDPSNHTYNYSYVQPQYPDNVYDFKLRLYSQFNNEDITIPVVSLTATDLNRGWHHFAITLNPPAGTLKLYVDGELYDTTTYIPNKFNFIPLVAETIFVGATPFYGGLTLNDVLFKNNSEKKGYFVKDLKLQDFYFISKELNYFDVNMLYKKKIPPSDLVWDVPTGRRNFIDTASRYFRQRIPGYKSGLINIYINDSVMSEVNREYLSTVIANKIKDNLPAYSKLNKINWITNVPSQSAFYIKPVLTSSALAGDIYG